jgi:hypothetical protein
MRKGIKAKHTVRKMHAWSTTGSVLLFISIKTRTHICRYISIFPCIRQLGIWIMIMHACMLLAPTTTHGMTHISHDFWIWMEARERRCIACMLSLIELGSARGQRREARSALGQRRSREWRRRCFPVTPALPCRSARDCRRILGNKSTRIFFPGKLLSYFG